MADSDRTETGRSSPAHRPASAGLRAAARRRRLNVVLVARRADRLAALADELAARHGIQTRVVAAGPRRAGRRRAHRRGGARPRDRHPRQQRRLQRRRAASTACRATSIVEMIQVNCIAVAALTHVFLPQMKARGRGAIVIVASVAGYQPLGARRDVRRHEGLRPHARRGALGREPRHGRRRARRSRPGPVETEFQAVAGETPHPGATPESVVEVALARSAGSRRSSPAGSTRRAPGRCGSRRARRCARLALGVMRAFIPEPMR